MPVMPGRRRRPENYRSFANRAPSRWCQCVTVPSNPLALRLTRPGLKAGPGHSASGPQAGPRPGPRVRVAVVPVQTVQARFNRVPRLPRTVSFKLNMNRFRAASGPGRRGGRRVRLRRGGILPAGSFKLLSAVLIR